MTCRHIKQNETYNLTVYSVDPKDISVEFYKIGSSVEFTTLPGLLTQVNNELFIKAVSFNTIGEYIVKVVSNGSTDYEKFKVYNFSDDDQNDKLNSMFLAVENINAELNDNLAFIKKYLKIINARI